LINVQAGKTVFSLFSNPAEKHRIPPVFVRIYSDARILKYFMLWNYCDNTKKEKG
jgi:hypothetical protein